MAMLQNNSLGDELQKHVFQMGVELNIVLCFAFPAIHFFPLSLAQNFSYLYIWLRKMHQQVSHRCYTFLVTLSISLKQWCPIHGAGGPNECFRADVQTNPTHEASLWARSGT